MVQDRLLNGYRPIFAKQGTAQETEETLQTLLEPKATQKVIYTNNSLEFGKACEDPSWNHCTSTPHRYCRTGSAQGESTSAVLLQSGLDEKWWADSVECYCHLRKFKTSYRNGKLFTQGVCENHVVAQQFLSDRWLNIIRFLGKTSKDSTSLFLVFSGIFIGYVLYRVIGGKGPLGGR